MLACFARGSGLDGRGCKRQRMRIQHDGRKSYLAHPSAGEFPVFRAPDVPPSRVSGPRSPASFGRLFRTMATSHLVSPRSCAQRRKNRCPLSSRCSRIRWHQGKSPPEPKKTRPERSPRPSRPVSAPSPEMCVRNAENSGSRDLPGKGARRAPTASRALSETSLRRRISPTQPLHYPSQKSRRRRRGRTGRWG